ncbi:MAG: DUF115 domain-containing protein [Candidatus Anaerobiospirillum pullicola]|uniref:DUF115 domain-containing protein n=1 Tax=Candidatus Anaerobiospirillum pullicola TaxID=2838451 RepID=A0A948TH88_9GAMM|nr:DUF115 domain-containing protein [Candidatus Anaerobiospirillum pullicola]
MSQEEQNLTTSAAATAATQAAMSSSAAAAPADSGKQEDFAPEAINIALKTRADIKAEFVGDLGFDPSDLDQLSAKMGSDAELDANIHNLMELQQQMGSMLIERFQKNMEAFKKYVPDIYERFKDFRPSEPLEFMCTANGIPNLFFPDRQEFFYKTYNPQELCNMQVDTVIDHCIFRQLKYSVDNENLGQIHHRYLNEIVKYQSTHVPPNPKPLLIDSCPICLMVGCGLGYQIGHLYERIDIGNLVLIEPNSDLFFASLHAFDWANLLDFLHENNRGIYFMVGQSKDQVFEDLNSFYTRHGRHLACFMWSLVHYRSPIINEISDRIIEDYERSYATLGFFDDHLFDISHGINHLINHTHFLRRNPPLSAEVSNIPFCIVANGPSLSNDLEFLRKVQDKVIIFACGTAIETLYNAGIRPTFYGCTERLRVVSEHLDLIPDQDFIRSCYLISADVVHPAVVAHFDHAALFGKADENFYWLGAGKMYDQFRKIMPISLMNPLVGNLGVAAATQLGFKRIYLFGVDNGTKREDKETHPDENLFYKKHKAASSAIHNLTYTMDGNFGGTVATSYLYRLSARYMNVIMRHGVHDFKLNYYNCSDGVLLDNAIPTHTDELEWWYDLPDLDRKKFFEYMDNEKSFALEFTDKDRESMLDPTIFDMVADLAMKMLKGETPETRLDFALRLQNVCEMLFKLHSTRDYYVADFFDGSLYSMFAMLMRSLFQIKDEKEAIRVTEDQIKYILYFIEDAKKIFRMLPDYCAEDHQKNLNGVVGFDHPDSKAPPIRMRKVYVTPEDTANYPTRKFVKRYE